MRENQNGNGKAETGRLLVFASVPQQVTQEDLQEERRLSLEISEKAAALEVIRTRVRSALERGCEVEPGLFTARLVERSRRGYPVAPCNYQELVIE